MRTTRIAGLALALTIATASAAFAQGRSLGVRVGTSVATLDTDVESILEEENRTGLVAGMFYNHSFGFLGYQLEVLYTTRGTKSAEGASLDLAYVEIPALLKVGVPVGVFRPGVFGGVALAVNVDCEVDPELIAAIRGPGIVAPGASSMACDDVSDIVVNDTEWNAVFGADLSIGLAGLNLWGDARYYMGLSDVGEFSDALDDVKNRSWELTAGVGIPLL